MLIAILVLFYASIKLIQLIEKKNPVISTYDKVYPTDYESPINLNELGYRVAIVVKDVWPEKKSRDDPAFIKHVFTYV